MRDDKRTQRDKKRKILFVKIRQIHQKQIAKAIESSINWKTSGLDQITNFSSKKLTLFHEVLVAKFYDMLKNP